MIKKEIKVHEEKVTNEIRNSKDVRCLWKYVNKLKGKETNIKEVVLYDSDGAPLQRQEEREQLKLFWEGVYKKHENGIKNKWSEEIRHEYE